MLRAKAAAPWRAIGIAALVALVLVVVSGGKAYYVIGSVPLFMAAGAIVTDRWLARGHLRLKAGSFATAAALSGAFLALLTLPILPVATFAKSSLPGLGPDPRPTRSAGRSSSRRWRAWSPRCPRTSAPTR